MKSLIYLPLTLAVCMASCAGNKTKVAYPETTKDTTVVEDYHGTMVADPYRWLEDDNSPQTAAWVEAQNKVTQDYLAQIPYRDQIKERLTALWDYPKQSAPDKVGEYYFFFRNDGLQNQSVLYRQKGLDDQSPITFLDPNKLSQDGTVALVETSFSLDNKYMAYSTSVSGSDWSEVFVMDVQTGQTLSDHIKWLKFGGASSWGKDGFYYSRYDEPDQKSMLSAQNRFQKVYYHKIGDPQSSDKLVYEDKVHPLRYFNAIQSEDGKYLFISSSEGTSGGEILCKDLSNTKSTFKVLFPGFNFDYTIVECKDDKAWVYTNQDAPNYRLTLVDLKNQAAGIKDVIAQNDKLLTGVNSVGGYLMASYLDKATSRAFQHQMDGKQIREVEFTTLGTAGGFSGKEHFTETFYVQFNFLTPPAIYRYDLATGVSTLFKETPLNYDPELYQTEQIFFPSKDGTQVSMFVVHRKDIKLNGNNPLYLYGYGGFNISMTPGFSPSNIMFMEQGGVYVMVNLRGGGEYGEKWHKAGMLEKKQNVFDDFIAAAEYLIEKKYTSSNKLAIAGGSNGGLLVGACMTQRPELFAVAFPAVGVMDMLRYHKFTVGWGWAVEYGSSDNVDQFNYLYRYSPLHNIEQGVCYPATLVTTADHDDRVVPAHSFKFAATLQSAQGCNNPTLIRIDTKAGHGAGKPTTKRIEEATDIFSFLLWNTNTKVKF